MLYLYLYSVRTIFTGLKTRKEYKYCTYRTRGTVPRVREGTDKRTDRAIARKLA